ncbi:MAG: hypothetical protein COA71_09950 [SAR86 cluster bacterium]|uniref:Uncharacterized protein n=1 Tax=SAR86 cluster bacterium TaxID=2030880 RepID=A0A2A5CAY0_9GAMM|nr:MAG: hypothetical protein COA71_09950 [SAR86 cluster bacterium]
MRKVVIKGYKGNGRKVSALEFHELAWPFLSKLEFELVNNPSEVISQYGASMAQYKSKNSFYIAAVFNSADANSASVSCGRKWVEIYKIINGEQSYLGLSGSYSDLVKFFGFDTPSFYEFNSEKGGVTFNKILKDIQRTLPTVLHKTEIENLISIESEPHGMKHRMIRTFGENYLEDVSISSFNEI